MFYKKHKNKTLFISLFKHFMLKLYSKKIYSFTGENMEKLNGTQVAYDTKESLRKDIEENMLNKGLPAPKLVVIMVGDNPASKVYVGGKVKACAQVGIQSEVYNLPANAKEDEVALVINKLNKDKTVNGILLQLPMPDHIDEQKMINLISPEKDVDGLTKLNLGKLMSKDPTGLFGCTPSGIIKILQDYNIEIKGKDVVIVNRSLLVGKPLALMFLNENATVTICHSKTKDMKEKLRNADIVVIAVGKKDFLTADMVKEGAIVIDVGINRDEKTNKICGDVDYEAVSQKASYITPVPGGVGPMTIAMLLRNTYIATMLQNKK